MAGGLCILAGVVSCSMFKILCGRKGKEGVAESSIIKEHYEVIDPIYATIVDSVHSSSGTQITMDDNHAYKTTNFLETTSYASGGIDVANNEAYIRISSELDVVQMKFNSSYQATTFNFTFSVAPAELTGACTQDCYDKQSVSNLKHVQQRSDCTDTSLSQKFNDKVTELQNQDPVLYVKDVDMDSTDSSKLTCEQPRIDV